MPFTPFHIGPAVALLPSMRFRHWIMLLSGSLLIDFEPFLVVVLGFSGTAHGFSHSLIGAALLALLIGCVGYFFFRRKISLKSAVLAALAGTWLHVFFDSPIYSDIMPFYPFSWNPLYGLMSPAEVGVLCIALFFVAAAMFFLKKN